MTLELFRQRFSTMRLLALLASNLVIVSSVFAHHSYAMFDKAKTETLKGTLYAVEWKNPHSWIWIAVTNDKGATEVWGLEGTSPAAMTRLGFTKKDLVVGTPVTATYNPLKDGRTGGGLVELKFADGRATK